MSGVLDTENPGFDDFEMWSPSEERSEKCLFGRQVSMFCCFRCYVADGDLLDSIPSQSAQCYLRGWKPA